MFNLAELFHDPVIDWQAPINCDRCGKPVGLDGVIGPHRNYASCGPCEDKYQESLAAQFPHGQCSNCGAAGEVVSVRGVEEIIFRHVEGGCPLWYDVVDDLAYRGGEQDEPQEPEQPDVPGYLDLGDFDADSLPF